MCEKAKYLYCARCDTPLMCLHKEHICPYCGAVFRHTGAGKYRFVADLFGASIKEYHRCAGEHNQSAQRSILSIQN